MLKVCLVIDCEKFISFKQGNPRWNNFEKIKGKINNLIKNFRYNKNGFDMIYSTLLRERFPATLMLVGSLYKPQNKIPFLEYGYHTFNHLPLTLIESETVKLEVKNIYNALSFSPPLWMVEDIKNPERIFRFLERECYKAVIYRGVNDGIKHKHHFEISKPIKKGKLNLIYVSNWIEGNSKKRQVEKIINEIKKNSNKNAIYCITTHDFTHKNNKNIIYLIRELKDLENKHKIRIMKIQEAIK